MVEIIGLVIATLLITVGGGGIWLLWTMTRPKKKIWSAKVYTVSEGIRPEKRDNKGRIISLGGLNDLKFFANDIIEKVKKNGKTIYLLQKMKKSLPDLNDDVIVGYGKGSFVNVVLKDGACTYLKAGFTNGATDKEPDNIIFQPVPYDSLNMVTNEIEIQRERTKDDKDILEKVLPWIGMGILMFSMVAVAYFMGQASIKSSDNFYKAANVYTEGIKALNGVSFSDDTPPLGAQTTTTTTSTTLKPPSIG